jgi:hypothetical protein
MLLAGVYQLLSTNAGMVAALNVGSRSDGTTGVFPGLAPKEASLPYVVVGQLGAESVTSFSGVNRLQWARLRFGCHAMSYLGAKTIARSIKAALNGLLMTLSDGSRVEGAEVVMELDSVEESLQANVFSTHIDFYVCFVDND